MQDKSSNNCYSPPVRKWIGRCWPWVPLLLQSLGKALGWWEHWDFLSAKWGVLVSALQSGWLTVALSLLGIAWTWRLYHHHRRPTQVASATITPERAAKRRRIAEIRAGLSSGIEGSIPSSDIVRLTGFRSAGHTSLESDRLIAPYLGQSMEVTVTISDVRALAGGPQVWVSHDRSASTNPADLSFDTATWGSRLQTLGRGSTIRVRGRLSAVYADGIALWDCELLE